MTQTKRRGIYYYSNSSIAGIIEKIVAEFKRPRKNIVYVNLMTTYDRDVAPLIRALKKIGIDSSIRSHTRNHMRYNQLRCEFDEGHKLLQLMEKAYDTEAT